MKQFWRNHSLSICCISLGVIVTGVSIPFGEGTIFDLISGFGLAFFSVGIYGILSGPLRERNKPEE